MTLNADVYEMEYSCSPGGIDCWEITIQEYGSSTNYTDFKSAGAAVNFLLDKYPSREMNLNITSLAAYRILTEVSE